MIRTALAVAAAFLGIGWIQTQIDRLMGPFRSTEEALYLPSGNVIKKVSLGHSGLLGDIYWMRAVQYYGGKRLKNEKRFDLLDPLLEISTTLDPHLLHAYRFGAIFLSEESPIGAEQPEKAIVLLEKGIKHNPGEWQLYRDLGFVYYWYLQDYRKAAEAFLEGSKNPNSALWMRTFAAELLDKGGNRANARFLWQQVYESSENEQVRKNAREHLIRLTAEEDLETLNALVAKVETRLGRKLSSLTELVQMGFFKSVPTDPKGFPYSYDPASGEVLLSPSSTVRRN
ncbi:MAG: hypothetical protein AB1898_14715 [Acidobacteriota bacterium]